MRIRSRLPATTVELAVLVSGVSSMGLEILAGRMVAPVFGSSIYTWGSIIGVFLAALSLGYARGGRRADDANRRDLRNLLLGSAAYIAFLILASEALLNQTALLPVPPRFASILPVTILFGPPVYWLGFISPYAAELSEKSGIGEASGHVYALGTIGSIAGAFGTTFLLVPSLDVAHIALLFGLLQLGAAASVSAPSIPRRSIVGIVLVGVLLVGAVVGGGTGPRYQGDVVYETQTSYQSLAVVDHEGVRTLNLGGERHSAMALDAPNDHVFTYTRYFHLPLLMQDDVDRVLFIGGGGFTGPKAFRDRYNVTIDVVEIDPKVVQVAEEYFAVEESPDMQIHVEDGRQYLRETNQTYDVIVLDAYRPSKVPFHLTTVEFMNLAASRLDEDGALVANVIAAPTGPASRFTRAQYKTMDRAFPHVYSFKTSTTSGVQNIELVASKDDRLLTKAELHRLNDRKDIGIDLDRAIDFYRRDLPTEDVPVLRDDRAPVDRLLDPALGGQYVVEPIGNETERNQTRTNATASAP
ncbi:MAG: spermidine synthase, partial [Halobacteriales archaeon]|jgi:spermidine synthase